MSEAADTETARAVKKTSRRALSYLLALSVCVPAPPHSNDTSKGVRTLEGNEDTGV